MYHLACYNSLVSAGAINADISAITDQSLTISNGHYVLTENARLVAAYAQGENILRARVNTPKLRATSLPYLEPVNRATAPGDLPPYVSYGQYALGLDPIDEIAFETTNDLASSTERHYIGAWFKFGERPVPVGPAFTVRATSSFTATANAWTAGAVVLDQVLPAGRYSVVGMRTIGTNLVLGRMIFPNQVIRPGVIASASEGESDFNMCRYGSMGELGQFDSIAQPQLEVIASGANTAQTLYMDLIRVR